MILLMAISNDIILQPILTTHNLWGNNGFLGNSKVIALFDMVSYQSPCTFFLLRKNYISCTEPSLTQLGLGKKWWRSYLKNWQKRNHFRQ